nr:tripartite tricarboxylate transporter substrate binding protein [Burkholderiaceae bacterium]
MHHTVRRRTALAALALTALSPLAQAQAPAANVRLLVGYAAGGPVDAVARIFAPALAKELGANVIVENKPGASGALAGEMTSTAAADGASFWFGA